MDLVKLRNQLVAHEGRKAFPYIDSVGKITIGVGRNLTDVGISETTINQMLDEDITKTVAFVTKNFPWWTGLDDVRQRAIMDLAFDLEGTLLTFHKMLAAIQGKDWQTAHDELLNSTFAHQTGKRAQDLAYQLLTGQDPIT